MTTIIHRVFSYLIQIIYEQTILVLILFFCISVSVALLSMSRLSLDIIDSQAIQSSALSVNSLKKAHNLYSEEVIKRAKTVSGITVSHEYLNKKGAIPPPITYTIELAKSLSDQKTGHLVRLFSDYPYPNRQKTGGVKDDFEQQAIIYLRQNPSKAFFRKENFQDSFSFRYAEAMIMKPSCVGCHNSHPKSPRKDWQIGDVRGVIEIAQPLDKFILQNKNGLQNIFLTLLGISCLGILGMTLIVGKLRHINTELETKVKNRTAELEFMAASDDLTQISNRRSFNQFLNQEWRKMMQQSKPLSLIICDIDHFKLYNDRYGHLAGDNCLIEVTQAIQNALSPTEDFLARYGGEEFIVVLPNRTLESAMEAAELIRQSVVNSKIVHEASPTNDYVSLSLGVSCTTPSPLQSSGLLINRADKALYMAKEKGRNCSVINRF